MDAKGVSSYNKEEMLEEKYPFLKQGHSFDTFVVSNSNNIAYNAAVALPRIQTASYIIHYSYIVVRDLEKLT